MKSTGVRFAVWLITLIALAGYPHAVLAQDRTLIPDSSIAIPPLQFDSSGALVIRASSTTLLRIVSDCRINLCAWQAKMS
jgi:hypothetical protein